MILYLDTSAIVKLYTVKPGSSDVKRWVSAAEEVVSCLIAYVETRSAFARKYRMRQMNDRELSDHRSEFEKDWTGFLQVPVDAHLVRIAGELAERFGLKGYDAIHLASADQIHREAHSQMLFGCFDLALRTAASSLGLKLVPSA